MNTFRQHIPNFVDVREEIPTYEFEGVEGLLALEVVKRYGQRKDFSHFAIDGHVLLEICDEGFYWWVVGYVEKPDEVDLPQWGGAKYRTSIGVRTDVVCSCMGNLTLADGRVVRDLRPGA